MDMVQALNLVIGWMKIIQKVVLRDGKIEAI
jgi:hypothetical protein